MYTYNDLSTETLAKMIVTINKVMAATTTSTEAMTNESLIAYRTLVARVGEQTAAQLLTAAWAEQQ